MDKKHPALVNHTFIRVLCIVLGLVLTIGASPLAKATAPKQIGSIQMVSIGSESSQVVTLNEVQPQSLTPTLTGKSFSLSFEDEILVNFYYAVDSTEGIVEQGMLVFYDNPGAADIAVADDVYPCSAYSAESGLYSNTTAGIAAKLMGDNRFYAAYAKLSDGTYVYSKLYQYSPMKYAVNLLSRSSTSAKQKALCVAMLNYGAAAQNYFGYKTDDLMNAVLTEEQKGLVSGYSADLFKGAIAADSSKIGSFTKTATGFSTRSASVSFDGAFAINYYFAPNMAITSDLTLYYWTPADYKAASVLTAENASGSFPMTNTGSGPYWGQVSGIAAKNLDETYYVAAVYTDGSGNSYCTGVIAYSLSKYCMNNAKDGSVMQELAAATAMYGYYAKEYFAPEQSEPVITEPTLKIATANAAAGTASLELPVSILNNPGVAGMTLSIEYDESVLTLTKVTTKEALAGLTFQKPKTYKNGCNLVWYGAEPATITDGNAFILYFTVSSNAQPGTYPVKLSYTSGYDSGLNSVDMNVIEGSIVVSG